jgi:hypothetical protein
MSALASLSPTGRFSCAAGAAAIALACAAPERACAQPRAYEGASLLVFPLFDSSPGRDTILNVVNRDRSRMACGNGFRQGDVLAHFTYVDEATGAVHLQDEFLSPGDSIAVLASLHNPMFERGYVYVELRDPDSLESLDHDVAFGAAIQLDISDGTFLGYSAIAFRGLAEETLGMLAPRDACGRALTIGNGDAVLDCDGLEYDLFPGALVASQFFEEGIAFSNRLILMTPEDAGPVGVSVRVRNNQGVLQPAAFAFERWVDLPLAALGAALSSLNGDPLELTTPGGRSIQAGWLLIEPTAPALGLLARRVSAVRFTGEASHALHFRGARAGGFPRT